jgi:polar amino acid transport system permease protein
LSAAALPAPARARGLAARATPTGSVLMLLWILAGAVIVYGLVATLRPDLIEQYGARVLKGYWTTIQLVVFSFLIGVALSIPVATGRLSRNPIAAGVAFGYSYFFRGTPLIAQLFLIYYGAGQFNAELRAAGLWWLFRDAFNCALIAFSLNTAAYQAEILAGAVRNVGRGQREGGAALGLSKLVIFRKIVLPQALIVALRPYGNEVVLLTKASAIASIVTVLDLMGQTRFVFSKTYDISVYFWAAIFYLVTVEIVSRIVNTVERRIAGHIHLHDTPIPH